MQLATADPQTSHPSLVLKGRFDAFETERFRTTVDELFAGNADSLSIDMSDVIFVDSSGLAELVRAMKHSRERGGDVHIVSPSDPVRVILELTRLDSAFSIVEN